MVSRLHTGGSIARMFAHTFMVGSGMYFVLTLIYLGRDELLGHGMATVPFIIGTAVGFLVPKLPFSGLTLVTSGFLLMMIAAGLFWVGGVFWLPPTICLFSIGAGRSLRDMLPQISLWWNGEQGK